MSSVWDLFDEQCVAQNKQTQLALEANAMAEVVAAASASSGLRDVITHAIGLLTLDENWLTLVGILQDRPASLAREADELFYKKCPKSLIEEFVANGDKGLLVRFLGAVNNKIELDDKDIRMMHMIIDSLSVLDQTERLKRVAKMFIGICESRNEGRLPGSVYQKLVEIKAIGRSPQTNSRTPATPAPIKLARKSNASDDNIAESHGNTGRLYSDKNPAHPPNGTAIPSNTLSAQLAKVTSASLVN